MSDTSLLQHAEENIDPAAALRLYQDETARVQRANLSTTRLYLALWGLVWLCGYGALYVSAVVVGDAPGLWAFLIFAILILAGIVGSVIIAIKRSRPVKGPSAQAAGFWGWSWALGFGGGMTMVQIIVARYDLSGEAIAVLFNAVAALIVGLLYMTGAAVFKELAMFIVGASFVILALVGTIVGVPAGYLVMALAGGGLMLVSLIIVSVSTRLGPIHRANAVSEVRAHG